MLSICTICVFSIDFRHGMSVDDSKLLYRDYLSGMYDLPPHLQIPDDTLRKLGLFSDEWLTWMDDDLKAPFSKEARHYRSRILRTAPTVSASLPPSFYVHARAFAEFRSSDDLAEYGYANAALRFYGRVGRTQDAPVVASMLLRSYGNFSDVYHEAILILHDIGTPDEIAVIDKAKENGLLATSGDFWKKAAEAKKAILARAEAKKNAELKAKPLDK